MRSVGELSVCGLVYQVYVASADETEHLADGDDGVCIAQQGVILIRASITPSRKRDALVHELAHAFLEASGLRQLLKMHVRGDLDELEEAIIRTFVPSFMRFLDDNDKDLAKLVKKGRWSK